MEPPVIRLAKARKQQDEMLDYPLDKGGRRPAPGGTRVAGLATRPGTGAPESDPDDVSIEAKFDRGSIQTVIAQRQRTLYPCFAEEARRSPGLTERIPIEFVIGNDGQVKKLWVDNMSPTRDLPEPLHIQHRVAQTDPGAEGHRHTVR